MGLSRTTESILPLASRRAVVGLGLTAPLAELLGCDPPLPPALPPPAPPPPPELPLPEPASALGARLEALLGVPGDGPRAREMGRYLAFAVPGIPFSKDEFGAAARPSDPGSFVAAARLARLLDPIPLPGARFASDGRSVANAYETTLRHAEVAAGGEPTEAERHRMEEARARIASLEESYTKYQQRYETARLAHASAELSRLDAKDGDAAGPAARREREKRAEVEAALAEWSAKGGREAYLDAAATIAQIAGRTPVLALRRLREELAIAERSDPDGQRYLQTSLCPADPFGGEEARWTAFHASGSEQAPAGVAVGPGLALPVTRLSCELLRATVVRPWLDPLLFRHRFWRLPPGFQGLSDGGDPPRGALVAYVSSILLSRELRVEITRGELAAGRKVDICAVGPLSLSGAVAGADGRSLCAPGTQIVGLVCELVPACPDPDPRIVF